MMLSLSSLDNLLSDACINFQKGVDNFETEYKTCYFWGRGVVLLKSMYVIEMSLDLTMIFLFI